MIRRLLRLWLAVLLILSASAVLLLNDRERPRGRGLPGATGPSGPARVRSIALFQYVSQETLEEGARGVLAGLAQKGYQEGLELSVHRYSAAGDAATSNTIARA